MFYPIYNSVIDILFMIIRETIILNTITFRIILYESKAIIESSFWNYIKWHHLNYPM